MVTDDEIRAIIKEKGHDLRAVMLCIQNRHPQAAEWLVTEWSVDDRDCWTPSEMVLISRVKEIMQEQTNR